MSTEPAKSDTLLSFPPASNWFESQTLATLVLTDKKLLVVYAGKQDLVLMLHNDPNAEGQPDGHEDCQYFKNYPRFKKMRAFTEKAKILSVALSLSPDGNVIVGATSEDGLVRFWIVRCDSQEIQLPDEFQEHTVHRELSHHKHRVFCGSWSQTDHGIYYTGDEHGNVVVWNTRVNAKRSISPENKSIVVMISHPTQRDVILYGCRFGVVFIVNTAGRGKVLHKIKAHEEDIQSVSWCPVNYNIFETEKEEDQLFSVASYGRNFSIWSSKGAQKLALIGPLKTPKDLKIQSWNVCEWVEPSTLLTNDAFGRLLTWDLTKLHKKNDGLFRGDDKTKAAQILHDVHPRILMNIESGRNYVFTIGQDRNLVCYNLAEKQITYNIPTFANWVYCIAGNKIDSSIVALGGGDGIIRIWKTGSKSNFDVHQIWQRLGGAKVTSLSWHPQKENLLAFGTDEGRIGTVDALATKSSVNLIGYKHRGTVYTLAWSNEVKSVTDELADEKTSQRLVLYSCGDGSVMMHKPDGGKPLNIEDLIKETNKNESRTVSPSRSEFAFHKNHSGGFLALGSDDGCVEIFSLPNLKLLITLKTFSKLIQSIGWHPTHCGVSEEESKYSSYLAIASNENNIHVFDLSNKLTQLEKSSEKVVQTTPDLQLEGHTSRVIQLAWSPHHEEILCSVSYDFSAQVWNVMTKTPLANYRGHFGRVSCCMFSPQNPDVIFTGGEDSSLNVWNLKSQIHNVPPKKSKKIIFPKKVRDPIVQNLPTKEQETEIIEMMGEKRKELLAASDKSGKESKVREKLLFPQSIRMENVKTPETYEECLLEPEKCKDKIHLGLFLGESPTERLLLNEATYLGSTGQTNLECHLRLWHGDVGDLIKNAIKSGQLNDWLINVARSVGHSLWLQACEAFAHQLEANDEPIKAASYLLMANKVKEAIHVLSSSNNFRSAISIAQSRLGENDPIIHSLHESWAKQAHSDGNYELATKCWVASGNLLQASSTLSKRNDPSATRVAMTLAHKGGDLAKAKLLGAQCQSMFAENKDMLEKVKEEIKALNLLEANGDREENKSE